MARAKKHVGRLVEDEADAMDLVNDLNLGVFMERFGIEG